MSCNPRSSRIKFDRRSIVALLASAPLAACQSSDVEDNSYKSAYSAVADGLSVAFGLKDPPMVSREDAAAIPYASIGYRIGDSAQGLLILASQTGAALLWTASNRAVIVTIGGRIVKTAGFPRNLGNTAFQQADPAADFTGPLPRARVSRSLDFPDLARFGVSVVGTFTPAAQETISILGQPLATRMVIEDCDCEEFDWQFQNKYWVDQDNGFVWRSEQYVHPKLDPLQITVFRPAK